MPHSFICSAELRIAIIYTLNESMQPAINHIIRTAWSIIATEIIVLLFVSAVLSCTTTADTISYATIQWKLTSWHSDWSSSSSLVLLSLNCTSLSELCARRHHSALDQCRHGRSTQCAALCTQHYDAAAVGLITIVDYKISPGFHRLRQALVVAVHRLLQPPFAVQ